MSIEVYLSLQQPTERDRDVQAFTRILYKI